MTGRTTKLNDNDYMEAFTEEADTAVDNINSSTSICRGDGHHQKFLL
jgi:hypothetical protein